MPASLKKSAAYAAWRAWSKRLRRRLKLIRYVGSTYRCPICETPLRAFKPERAYAKEAEKHGYIHPPSSFETFNEKALYCPACGATDRERLTALYLEELLRGFDPSRRYRVIEVAPSESLSGRIMRHPFIEYRSADLNRRDVQDRIDLTDMHPYPDESVDLFLCSHVLEHVLDDRRAMREIHRVLKHDGVGVLLVPLVSGVEETEENPAHDTIALRWKHYGFGDHVRLYGKRDFIDRLRAAGLEVGQLGIDHFGRETFRQAGIAENSVLYVVRRAAALT